MSARFGQAATQLGSPGAPAPSPHKSHFNAMGFTPKGDGTTVMAPKGHMLTHVRQPTQRDGSLVTTPVAGSRCMAPEMQPSTHFGAVAAIRREAHDVVALDALAVVDFIARKRKRLHDVSWPRRMLSLASHLATAAIHAPFGNRVNPLHADHCSPAYFTPRISSSFSFSPTPRSMSRLPRRLSMALMPMPPMSS